MSERECFRYIMAVAFGVFAVMAFFAGCFGNPWQLVVSALCGILCSLLIIDEKTTTK